MDSKNYQEDLTHIRSMMERSSRCISLSGLSGIFAGLVALLGAIYGYFVFQREGINYFEGNRNIFNESLVKELVLIGTIILLLALLSGYFFTSKKSKTKNVKIWDQTTKRLLFNFAIHYLLGDFFV